MSGWRLTPQPDDRDARVKEGPDARIELLWGGKHKNQRGDDHGHLKSRDGVNADYLRHPGGEVIVDARRAAARAIADEAKTITGEGRDDQARLRRLETEWSKEVLGRGPVGRDLATELDSLRSQLDRARERSSQVKRREHRAR